MKIEEFNIPVPWGHITVKAWGNSANQPILVTHGRMDNAGSFDGLIPLLPDTFYYICIDLPSHGRSSHIPPYFPIRSMDFVMVYKMVLDHFNRGKYILLGHSFGAAIGQYFARFYPEYVEKLINIDCVCLHGVSAEEFKQFATERYNGILSVIQREKTGQKPSYTEGELIEKIKRSRSTDPISTEAARSIAIRTMEPVGNGRYTISVDQRMKFHFDPVHSNEYAKETLKQCPITCPYLLLLSKRSVPIITDMHAMLDEIEKWEKSKVIFVDGGHDVHMTHPELVASYIRPFILSPEGKL